MARPGWYNDNVNRSFPFLETTTGEYYLESQAVSAMTGDQVSPIIITSAIHGLESGYEIVISGSTGNTAANGTWTITKIDENEFSLNGSTGDGIYIASASWSLPKPPSMKYLPSYFVVDCGFTLGGNASFPVDTARRLPTIENLEAAVYLKRVYRAGNEVTFEFRCTDPKINEKYPLIFTRDITVHTEYDVEYADSDSPDAPDSTSESVPASCQMPFWSGYLVTGDMALIAANLPDGESIIALDWALTASNTPIESQEAVVEPAVIQNLSRSVVSGINIANDDRTRATPPNMKTEGGTNSDGCDPFKWPFNPGLTYVSEQCLMGDVRFKPGYNTIIISDATNNTITFRAALGTGEGQPCNHETKLFPAETGPTSEANTWDNNLLEGGPICKEVARSVNGIGGPLINFVGGQGISIIPDPSKNKVIIDVDLKNMDLCQYSTYSVG